MQRYNAELPISSVLAHELLMKLGQTRNNLLDGVFWRQDGGPDVEGAFLLSKSRAWHCADACRFKQSKAVERVCSFCQLPLAASRACIK